MCVLVVEDDFLIRMILIEDLLEAGYEVREAETGDEAMAIFDSLDPQPKILVTDIHMPGEQNGLQLATHIRSRLPEFPVIYMTGRPDALAHLDRLGAKEFLVRKPFLSAEIIGRIEQLLAA